MIDLLSERVGGRVLSCNDEFFAEASNLIANSDPVWREGEYTDRGKWMDGWETRRRREPGHDWCELALGVPGRIERVTVDTSHFTGNYPEFFSLEASPGRQVWSEVIPKTVLSGDTSADFDVDFPRRVSEVRFNIFPDGGVARLRIEGHPIPAMDDVCPDTSIDLLGAVVGGRWLEASDYHYSPPANLLRPTEPVGMWDGWETKRRRGPGNDWATFQLGLAGSVEAVVVDTRHFKGNSPGWVSLGVSDDGDTWTPALSEVAVMADTINELALAEPVSAGFVKLSIHPDGGVARLRVLGRAHPMAAGATRLEYLNSLFDEAAAGFLRTACAADSWIEAMMSRRPFGSIEEVFERSNESFDGMVEADWLEAFAGHPRIGERGGETASKEQAGSAGYEAEFAEANRLYEDRFGFIYIVYATGKTGEEMLRLVGDRLENDRAAEIANAAAAHRQITTTRLAKMLCQEDV